MAQKVSHEFHHNFPKLAEESGFTFNTHRPRNRLDWSRIRSIELDSLVRDRKFTLIEQHLSDILECALDSEFDVRILDEGVVKIFRLAQLAVEYQQFCRHYLDRSVFVLREEISALIKELNANKKEVRDKEDEIRKIKRKSKQSLRTPVAAYGNENIANLILRTLANKGETFPSISNGEVPQYNKCTYCDKVFLNQLYLKGHISRRHTDVTELPERDTSGNDNNTRQVNNEIIELKSKLNEMELLIKTLKSQQNQQNNPESEVKIDSNTNEENKTSTIETKDAEVSINNESNLLDKFEEWKKEEHEKYNREINLLRKEILETINIVKHKEETKPSEEEQDKIKHLYLTIKDQGAEIVVLKQELANSKQRFNEEETKRKREIEEQINLWNKRAETQSSKNEVLLQKLKEVSKDAEMFRDQAEAERKTASELQALLQQYLKNQSERINENSYKDSKENTDYKAKLNHKDNNVKPKPDLKTLEDLHRTAQELLGRGSISSSESSSIGENEKEDISPIKENETKNKHIVVNKANKRSNKNKLNFNVSESRKINKTEYTKQKKLKEQKLKSRKKITKEPEFKINPGSPMKVVRAKITEAVNNRLVSAGIDPLKNSLSQSVFRKQRRLLQHEQELKVKKNPSHEKVRHSILAYLDSTTAMNKVEVMSANNIVINKMKRPFSFSSVLSNVKSKALSLVKSNDLNKSPNYKLTNTSTIIEATTSKSKLSPSSNQSSSPTPRENIKKKAKLLTKYLNNTKPSPTEASHKINISQTESDESNESDDDSKDDNTNNALELSKSIEKLIKSPIRCPSSASTDYKSIIRKYTENDNMKNPDATSTQNNIHEMTKKNSLSIENNENSSDEIESLMDSPIKKYASVENIQNSPKQTKSVLKNASSTSSLNKKKVLFDMDAIQMKSLSASPSQSITEKSDGNEKTDIDIINLRDEEWDISSIDSEPLNNDTKIQVRSQTSPKIAELKAAIENQLARRSETPSTAVIYGVDMLKGPMVKAASIGGSNTSLGSSILDESDNGISMNTKTSVKPKLLVEKDNSELEISEFRLEGIFKKNHNGSF